MLCAKFAWNRPNGWNWPSGSWEENENVKSLQTDGQQAISKNWEFSSGELKGGGDGGWTPTPSLPQFWQLCD